MRPARGRPAGSRVITAARVQSVSSHGREMSATLRTWRGVVGADPMRKLLLHSAQPNGKSSVLLPEVTCSDRPSAGDTHVGRRVYQPTNPASGYGGRRATGSHERARDGSVNNLSCVVQ